MFVPVAVARSITAAHTGFLPLRAVCGGCLSYSLPENIMRILNRRCLPVLLLSCMLPLTSPDASAQPVRYSATEIGILPGLVSSNAASINNAGQIAGNSFDDANHPTPFVYAGGQLSALPGSEPGFRAYTINDAGMIAGATDSGHAFRYVNGTITFLNPATPDASARSLTFGMNEAGTIVGASTGDGRPWRAFVAEGDVIHELDIPGESLGYAINNRGEVTGVLRATNSHRGFLYSNGTYVDIGDLGSTYTVTSDINDTGAVVGQTGSEAFIYENGAMRGLGSLTAGTESHALAINNRGQVVGRVVDEAGHLIPFLWQDDTMYDLRDLVDPGFAWGTYVDVTDINERGQIVGMNCAATCVAFVLTPVPEPFMAALLGPGLGLLGLRLRRRT